MPDIGQPRISIGDFPLREGNMLPRRMRIGGVCRDLLIRMYLLSWKNQESRLEASLGGRVTLEEIKAFADELRDLMEDIPEVRFLVVLDASRIRPLDAESNYALSCVKDYCLERGADRVVTIARDEDDRARIVADRLQVVLEGREHIILDAAAFQAVQTIEFSAVMAS